jgi:5'-nucleotidase
VKGIAVTMQGKRDQDLLRIDPRHDGRGNPYYWLTFARKERPKPRDGTDLSAMADKRISVTALRLDLTDEPFMARLGSVFK